jgi:RHS repeat-associated protein
MTSNGTGSGTPIGTVTTRQEFDADGRMVKKFDPNGNVTAFHYDPLGRLVQTDFADGTHETDAYDRYGNLSRTTDANGTVAEMTYDLSGRMTERTITRAAGIEGATFENYQYDGLGQITHAENDHSVVSLTYDSQGKVLSETSVVDDVSVTTSASYDGLGNQRTLTYPSGFTVNRTYDALHRVVGIEDDTRSLANYTWIGPNTRRETIVFGNGARVDYAFDTLGRVTRMTHVGSSGLPFEDRQYGWDNTSHVTSHDNLLFSTTHYLEYDSFYRLRQSVKPGETVNYELDAAGNRTSVSGGFAAGGYSVVPASMNQYAATPGDTRTYDNAGNLLQIDADATDRHLTFDYRGRITGVSGDGVPTTTFWYDALGRRIDKESAANGETTRTNFRNFGSDIVEVRFEDGTAGGHRVVDYVHGALLDEIVRAVEVQGPVCACTKDYRPVTCNGVLYNNPCLAACAGCVDGTLLDGYWPHADLNGNVIAMLDASGKLIERFTYDDYGQPTVNPAIGPGCPACTKDFKPVTCGGVVYPNACLAACAGCSHTMDVTRSAFLFQGRLYDPETGLYDFRNRSYDPMSGRFVSRDPLGLWGDPIELGVGDAFVGNDPWNSTDPFGNYRKAGDTFTDCQDKCIDAYVNTSVVHEIFYAIDIFGSADIGCKLFCSSAWPWPAPGSLVTFKNPSDGGWSRYNTGGIYKDLIKVQTKLDVNPSGGVWSINQHSTDHYQNVLNLKTSPTWGPVGPWRPRPSPFPWPLPPGSPGPTIPYPDFPDPSAMQISSPNAQAAGKPYLDWCECCRSTGNWICCLACFTGAENPGSYSHAPISAMTTWSTCESEGPVEVPGVGPVLGTSDKLCPGSAHCTYRYPAAGSK